MSHANSSHVVASVVTPVVTSVLTLSRTLSQDGPPVVTFNDLLQRSFPLSICCPDDLPLTSSPHNISIAVSICCASNTPAPAGGQNSRNAFIGNVSMSKTPSAHSALAKTMTTGCSELKKTKLLGGCSYSTTALDGVADRYRIYLFVYFYVNMCVSIHRHPSYQFYLHE